MSAASGGCRDYVVQRVVRRSTVPPPIGVRPCGWTESSDSFDRLLDRTAAPAARISHERVAAYARNLAATTAPFRVQSRIRHPGSALRAIAPDGDWRWIPRDADRLRARARPVRDKRPRLQSVEALLELGLKTIADAEVATDKRPAWRAANYRDGLLIALLACRPVRRRNIIMIEYGVSDSAATSCER